MMHPVFLLCGAHSSVNHHGHHYYQHIAEKMAFGRLMAPDESVIRARLPWSSAAHLPCIPLRGCQATELCGSLRINSENTYVSTRCSGQAAAAHCHATSKSVRDSQKKKKRRKKCPTQSLEASRIREALEKYVSQSREVGGE